MKAMMDNAYFEFKMRMEGGLRMFINKLKAYRRIIMTQRHFEHPHGWQSSIFLLLLLLASAEAQLLLTAIGTTNSTIIAPATYTFSFSRFATASIPLNSYLLITFSGQYAGQIPASPTCTATGLGNVSPTCSFSASALYVSQLFTNSSSLSASSFSLSVSYITNPSPASAYTPISAVSIIAPNSSVFESGTVTAGVTITGGTATCLSSISNAYVFKQGQVTITYSSNYISAASSGNYDIFVSIPTAYPDDLTATDTAPVLSGTLSVYPSVYLFQTAFTSSFTVTILMPPSTKPQTNFISIYTQTNTGTIGAIDSCAVTIANIQPNTFSSISISQGTVQTAASLMFDLTLSTPLFQSDTLTISFPSGFGLAAVGNTVSIAGFGVLTLTRYDSNLLISSISSQAVLNARLIFNISSIVMPFNTIPSTLTISLATSGNYSRIIQVYSYAASPGPMNVTVYCLNTQIGTVSTRCLFSFSTVSTMTANGSLNVMFPSDFPVGSGSSECAISGSGLNSNINCLYTSTNNSIQANSLTSGTANIPPMPITLNANVSMSKKVGNYSLTITTQSFGGTVDQGVVTLTTTSRMLKSSQFVVTSSSSVTNSPALYTLYFSLPFDLGVTYTVSLTLPFAVQSGLSVSLTGGALLSFSNSTLTFTTNQLTNNASISIANLMTANSKQPATISVQVIYQSTTYFYGSTSLTMTQLKEFGYATVGQSNQMVYASAIATITLSGLTNGDKIVLSAGYANFYQASQPNCSSTVANCGVSGVMTALNVNSSGTTSFNINIQNLGYVGQSQLNITSYDSAQNYAKLSSLIPLTFTTPNAVSITANQTNPYLNQQSTYTFALQFTTPGANILLVTPPSGIFISSANCLLNCGNASKLTVGYLFPVSSTNCMITFTLTNPTAFGSSVKFVFKTSNSLGDMDYGDYIPQAICASPCRSCSAVSSTCLTCYSWSSQTILYNNTCINSCPVGFYQALSSGISVCLACSSLCTVCSSSSANCSSCQNGTYLYNSGCYLSCPIGTFTSPTNVCITCLQVNCSVCNATTCTQCLSGAFFFNGLCLATCLSNYYSYGGNCVPCASTCLVCSPTNGSCSSCLTPNFLYGGACYSSCPNGVFQQLNNNLCQSCQSPCGSCSLFSTNCTSCLRIFNSSSYYYLANICYPNQCPNGYFGDSSSNLCIQCPLGCPTCTSSACLSCISGQFLYHGICYSQCPSGTYQNSTNCLSCSSICANCLSTTTCTSCISGYNLYNSTCLLSCPTKYFSNLTGNICLPCSSPCDLCSYLGCINCLSGYYLQQTTCTSFCTGVYHPNNSTMLCQTCRAPCSGCTWSTTCTSCVSRYSLLGTSCLSSCPIGYYSNGDQCISCPGNCTTCTFINNQPACTACENPLLLFSFSCIGSCPTNTKQANGYCMSSDCTTLPHCLSCAGTQCMQCASLYQMDSTYACSQSVNGSAIANALLGIPVPFPFLISILMVIIISFLLKHNFPKMFSPLFIYAIAGCFEFLCLVLWTLLSIFWNMGNETPLPYESVIYAPVVIGCVYVVFNVLQFILWNTRILTDKQYKLWEKQDNRCASLSIAIVALIFSFRLDALKFSKTGHNPHLSARLSSPEIFRHYSILAILSLFLSGVTILVSIYVSYLQTSLNYLFFTGIQVILIAIIMVILSVAVLCVSKQQLLEDKSEYQVGYDQDQIEGKSVEQLLNGLGVVEEHHEHNHYEDSGNAVLMKNDYSSQNFSQDLTLMEPAAHLAFEDKVDSHIQLNSQSRKKTQQPQGTVDVDQIFGTALQSSSENHILIDEFERDKNEALQLTKHYGLTQQPATSTYPRQTGAIVKQRLPSLHEDSSEIQSVGSFEQFTLDIPKGKWKKQASTRLVGQQIEPQGDDIEEFQLRQIMDQKIKQEQAERKREKEQRERFEAEQQRQEELRRRVEDLKLQQIAKEQERVKVLVKLEQLKKKEEQLNERQRIEKQQQQKKRKMQERMRKLQEQKKRQEQWRLKKQEARLKKIEQQRILNQKMERLRRQEEQLQRKMKQQQAKEMAKLEQERIKQLQKSKKQLQKINSLKASLQALEGITGELQAKNQELQHEQKMLKFHEQEQGRENRERGFMAVEDRLSRMAIVFEDMWKKAVQLKQRPPKKIKNQQSKQAHRPNPINYHNADDQNLISELSPRKIKVSPRPLPEQYTRKHLYVEQGKQILSQNSSDELQEELQIIFDGQGNNISEERTVDKPKSILQHQRPVKTKIDYLVYEDKEKKEVQQIKLKKVFADVAGKHESLRSAPHKQMPKQDTEEPITMVFQNRMAEVLEEQEIQEKQSSVWSRPSQQQKSPKLNQVEEAIEIEYVGRSIHSGSSDTHWPIQPQMQQRIQEIERRANRYINQAKKKEVSPRHYVFETPQDRIYEEEEEAEGETQLGEIVFQESDQILESESRGTNIARSVGSSTGRKRYPTGRVNRRVIDLSPDK